MLSSFQLDEDQERAVYHDGNLVIPAVPGSGKTAVLVHRVQRLVDEGVDPTRIACLTFLKKAQQSLRDRLDDLVGEDVARRLETRTYHSIGANILRDHGHLLHPGFERATLVKDGDLLSRMRRCLKASADQLGLKKLIYADDRGHVAVSPKTLQRFSSTVYDLLLDVPTLSVRDPQLEEQLGASGFHAETRDELGLLIDALKRLDKDKLHGRWMSFDDMIQKAVQVAILNPKVAAELSTYYDHVLVDEYQDTSPAQQVLVEILSVNAQLVMVADDDQCIYSWRRANPNLFIDATKSPRFELIKLQRNYRSGQTLLDHADRLIQHNTNRIPKTLNGVRSGGTVKCVELPNAIEEARYIRDQCRYHHEKANVPYEEMMVLVRTNAQLGPLSESFTVAKIPHHVPAATKCFADMPEVLDLEGYLQLAVVDNETKRKDALARIYNRPFRSLNSNWLSECESTADFSSLGGLTYSIRNMPVVGRWPALELDGRDELLGLLNAYQEINGSSSAEYLRVAMEETGYANWVQSDGDEQDNYRVDNVRRAIEMADRYPEPLEFLGLLNRMRRANQESNRRRKQPGVTLSTVHRAKGLECDIVYVAGCKPGYMPHALCEDSIEEERRICYVAVTRARKLVVLTRDMLPVTGCSSDLMNEDFAAEMGVTCQAVAV